MLRKRIDPGASYCWKKPLCMQAEIVADELSSCQACRNCGRNSLLSSDENCWSLFFGVIPNHVDCLFAFFAQIWRVAILAKPKEMRLSLWGIQTRRAWQRVLEHWEEENSKRAGLFRPCSLTLGSANSNEHIQYSSHLETRTWLDNDPRPEREGQLQLPAGQKLVLLSATIHNTLKRMAN